MKKCKTLKAQEGLANLASEGSALKGLERWKRSMTGNPRLLLFLTVCRRFPITNGFCTSY